MFFYRERGRGAEREIETSMSNIVQLPSAHSLLRDQTRNPDQESNG